jgi:hypothetical protein
MQKKLNAGNTIRQIYMQEIIVVSIDISQPTSTSISEYSNMKTITTENFALLLSF